MPNDGASVDLVKSGIKSFPGQVNDLLIELLISVMRSI
jgi:hypothetical protein